MKIVDIHKKEIVYRKAVAKAVIETRDQKAVKRVLEENLEKIVRTAERGVRTAWLHIPLLHPLPIARVEIEIGQIDDIIELSCSGETYYRTGIEMDVLFGAACGVSLIFQLLKGEATLRELSVLEKVKRDIKESIEDLNGTTLTTIDLSLDIEATPPGISRSYVCEGSLKLREETIERILRKDIEKGDPLTIGELASLENAKRFSEIVGKVYHILNARARTEITSNDGIKLRLELKSIEDAWGPTAHGVLSGLIAMWDVVKKYEKDSSGQYPFTRIVDVGPISILDS